MKRYIFIILSCALLLTGCGKTSDKRSTSPTTNQNTNRERKVVYEDIEILDIIVPKELKTEIIFSTDASVEFTVDRKSVIRLRAIKSDDTYDEESIKEYIRSESSLMGANTEDLSAIDVEIVDVTSSIFTLYKASYNSAQEYYGFGEHNGYVYLALLEGSYDSEHPSTYLPLSDTDVSSYYEDFKNTLDMAQIIGDSEAPTSTNKSDWEIKYFVDKFGDPNPNNPYIGSKNIKGTFSNSATKDDLLYARIIIDDELAVKLYEYGQIEVTNSYSRIREYSVTFKYASNQQFSFVGTMNDLSGDRIFLNDGMDALIDHLSKGETVKVYIEEKDRPICNYLFSIDGTGFKEVYDEYNE